MAGDWRDDPAFLRDEATRQAALATGAMREADALREQLRRADVLVKALEAMPIIYGSSGRKLVPLAEVMAALDAYRGR